MSEIHNHFIIGGAPRCGTTWLVRLLERHPQVYIAKPVFPEPKFFLVDELYGLGLTYYFETWFRNAPTGSVAGEKSANYLENSHLPERIYKHLPDVKLIFILRDPIERAFSNYLFSRMNGFETEDFETAIKLEESRKRSLPANLRYTQPFSYFSRGLYAKHLVPFFEKFPRNNILCLRFEDMVAAPELETRRVHSFLGLTVGPQDAFGLGVINKADGRDTQVFPPDVIARLRDAYLNSNSDLTRLLGPRFQWG